MPHAIVSITLKNSGGLHARPSALLTKMVVGFQAQAVLTCRGKSAQACDITDLLMLGAGCGSSVGICATGPEAEACIAAIRRLFTQDVFEFETTSRLVSFLKEAETESAEHLSIAALQIPDLLHWFHSRQQKASAGEFAVLFEEALLNRASKTSPAATEQLKRIDLAALRVAMARNLHGLEK